jgi:O-antigen/teichoic acid export membrane protein
MTIAAPEYRSKKNPLVERSSLAGDIFKLISGTASSQLIGIAAAPLIARLFSPEAFGGLALFAAASGTIGVVACFRYELAILLPEKDREATHILWLCLFLLLATTAATTIALALAGGKIWLWVNAPALKAYGWLIPVNVLVAGVFSLLTIWNMRCRRFGRLTVLEVVSRISITGSQILVAFSGFASAGTLMATAVFGTLVATTILAIQTWHENSDLLLAGLRWQPILTALRRYCRFPKFSAAAALLNAASGHSPSVLLSGFFSIVIAGQYSFGDRLMRVPSQLIGNSFSQAFFPRAAEATLAGTLGHSVEAALEYLIKMSMFPCLLLTLIGKALFVVVFGEQWAEAGVFSQILSPMLFMWFISSPLNTVLVVLEQQDFELRFQILTFASRLGSLAVGGLLGSARLALILFATGGVLLYGSYCIAIILKSGASPAKIVKMLYSSFLWLVPASMVVLATMHYSTSPVPVVVVFFALLSAYYLNLFRMDPAARRLLSEVVRKFSPVGPPNAS